MPKSVEQTPFDKFKDLARKVISVPKAVVDRKAKELKRRKNRKSR